MMLRRILQGLSCLALAGTILPSFLFMAGRLELKSMYTWMLAATVLWFVATSLWMGRKTPASEA